MFKRLFSALFFIFLAFGAAAQGADIQDADVQNASRDASIRNASVSGWLVGLDEHVSSLFSADAAELEPIAPSVGVYFTESEEEARRLLESGAASYIEPNAPVELLSYEQDTLAARQWPLLSCGFGAARRYTRGGESVLVGVVDSGIEPQHPDFGDNILEGYSTISGVSSVQDTYGHGTAAAGIIAARAFNGEGIAGIADNVQILPVRFTSGKTTTSAALVNAISYAVDMGCDVINVSAGSTSSTTSLKRIIDRAYENNIIVVASAGNNGLKTDLSVSPNYKTLLYPAAYDTVVGVGAIDAAGNVANFSQRSAAVMVCAPGVDVVTTMSFQNDFSKNVFDLGYASLSGTSFAAPHVAAAAALAKSIAPDLSPDEFMSLLCETATDCGDTGYDSDYGYGILNAAAILDALDPSLAEERIVSGEVSSESGEVEAVVKNNTALPMSGTLYMAFFGSDGSLCAPICCREISVAPEQTLGESVPAQDCARVRGFFWSDMENMTPLMRAVQWSDG